MSAGVVTSTTSAGVTSAQAPANDGPMAELRALVRAHAALAAGGLLPGVARKRTYLWLVHAQRLLDVLLAGDTCSAERRDDAFATLRSCAYDMIEHCDWMSDVYRHEYRKFVARTPRPRGDRSERHLAALAGLFRYVNLLELKVTSGCNLPCTYCNMDAEKPTAQRMSMAVLRDAVSLLMRHSTVPHPDVEFHGGEPLLLPDSWFEDAVEITRSLAEENGKRVRFRMVTNGVLLSDTRIDLVRRLGISLCLSLDGPPEINDVHRKSGALVEESIRRLNAKGVPFALLSVITHANASRMPEVLDHFSRLGLECIDTCFNQPQGRGVQLEELSVEDRLAAMTSIMDHMAEPDHRASDMHVARVVRRFMRGRPEHPGLACTEKECLAGRSFITVDPAGGLYSCATDLNNHRIGDIRTGVDREHVNRTLVRLHEKDDWHQRCSDCAAMSICDYGCPTSQFQDPTHRDAECAHTKALYAYLDTHRDQAARIHDHVEAREQQWAERKRERLTREGATPSKAVRRLKLSHT